MSASWSYSPWGEPSGSAGELPFFGYAGQEHSGSATALQYLRARWYGTSSAAFTEADPYLGDASDPSTLNRYAYCAGNPVAFSDPSGNERFSSQKQRKDWQRNYSVSGKTSKTNTQILRGRQTALPGQGAIAFKKSTTTLPLYNVQAKRIQTNAPYASQKYRTELPGRMSPVKTSSGGSSSGSSSKSSKGSSSSSARTTKSSSGSSRSWSWSSGGSGGLFPHVLSYAQAQAIEVRERFCSRSMEYMVDREMAEAAAKYVQPAHDILEVAGIVPLLGTGTSLLNAAIYFAQGDDLSGMVELGYALPFAGNAARVPKAIDAAGSVAKTVGKVMKAADAATDAASDVSKKVRVAKQNKAGTIRLELREDGAYDLVLKMKEGWTMDQRQQALRKASAITMGDARVAKSVERTGASPSAMYKKEFGADSIPPGYDIDHLIDLQLSGSNSIDNLWPLDSSVNRSMGSQISYLIRDLDAGTIIGRVRFE